MPITPADIAVLTAIAKYYLLTRAQIQWLCFPNHKSGRSTRKHLGKLRRAGLINKHRLPIAFEVGTSTAPVYYPTAKGAELLASYHDDERYLVTNTRTPRADRLPHWIAVSGTRIVIDEAIARQSDVVLDRFINEWETVNKDASARERFYLQTQLRANPPLSCSPDAAFLLSLRGHRKVFYLEQDLGTSSPRQIAARKTQGYAELARRHGHRAHFPTTTLDTFSVLLLTTTPNRRDAIAKAVAKKSSAELWLFAAQSDLTAESFLHAPITYNVQGVAAPLIKPKTITNPESNDGSVQSPEKISQT